MPNNDNKRTRPLTQKERQKILDRWHKEVAALQADLDAAGVSKAERELIARQIASGKFLDDEKK
jgi:hypothetical protein